jgi:hypothetical protein
VQNFELDAKSDDISKVRKCSYSRKGQWPVGQIGFSASDARLSPPLPTNLPDFVKHGGNSHISIQ